MRANQSCPSASTTTPCTDWPSGAGLAHRHAAVLDAVHALVVVEVVRLAVGQHQQQPPRRGLLRQHRRGVADRGAEPGVVAGPEAADARGHRRRHRLVEAPWRGSGTPGRGAARRSPRSPSRSPAPSMPAASAASASRAMSMTLRVADRRLGRARAVDQDRDATGRAPLAARRLPEPVVAGRPAIGAATCAATAASRSRSAPSICRGSSTRRGCSGANCRRTRATSRGSGTKPAPGLALGLQHADMVGHQAAGCGGSTRDR